MAALAASAIGFSLIRYRRTVGRKACRTVLPDTPQNVGNVASHEGLAFHKLLAQVSVNAGPIPLGPGEVACGGQAALVRVITRRKDPPLFSGFHHHLGAIYVGR